MVEHFTNWMGLTKLGLYILGMFDIIKVKDTYMYFNDYCLGFTWFLAQTTCGSMPCQNGGTCVDVDIQDVGYRCECPPEWTGMDCETSKRCNELS